MVELWIGALVTATVLVVCSALASWRAAPARCRAAALVTADRVARPLCPDAGLLSALDARISDALLPGSPSMWLGGWVAAAGAGATAGWLVGQAVLAAIGAAVGAVSPWLVICGRRGRAGAVVEAALPSALEAVATGLRAGSTLPLAVAAAARGADAPLAAELRRLADEANCDGLVAATDAWVARSPHAAVRLTATALGLSAEVGGAGARALDGVALTVRQRREAAGEVRALATQARLSAVILATAPLVFAGLAASADPRTLGLLLTDPFGQVCLSLGLLLDGAGALWMGRITRAGAA